MSSQTREVRAFVRRGFSFPFGAMSRNIAMSSAFADIDEDDVRAAKNIWRTVEKLSQGVRQDVRSIRASLPYELKPSERCRRRHPVSF